MKYISINLNHHLFFNSNWKLLPGHGLGSTERKLKYFNIFTHTKSEEKRRSQHAEDQEDSELKVSQDTINSSEDRTEVLQEEEATSILLCFKERRFLHVNSTQHITTKTRPTISTKTLTDLLFGT